MVTTPPLLLPRDGSRSGRIVCITSHTARPMVVAWAKVSQILRIGGAEIDRANDSERGLMQKQNYMLERLPFLRCKHLGMAPRVRRLMQIRLFDKH
jgi:hypothetical protein